MTTVEVPVFAPTMEEFRDFQSFIKRIEPICANIGLCKIIPPPEWKARSTPYPENFQIGVPIRQHAQGQKGVYEFQHEEQDSKTVDQWRVIVDHEESHNCDSDDFAEIERKYWKTIGFRAPLYGADTLGTLFDHDLRVWNLAHLDDILKHLGQIPGVNTPYLYFGSWKATFCWHTEDLDLFSINYLHWGEPKDWYTVPPPQRARMERLAESFYPQHAKECAAFLRHKTTLISPHVLAKENITVVHGVQQEGEFMITWPGAYHAGFNHGLNCAEAVNFATTSWLPLGRASSVCRCVDHSVRINIDELEVRLREAGVLPPLEPSAVPVSTKPPPPRDAAAEFLDDGGVAPEADEDDEETTAPVVTAAPLAVKAELKTESPEAVVPATASDVSVTAVTSSVVSTPGQDGDLIVPSTGKNLSPPPPLEAPKALLSPTAAMPSPGAPLKRLDRTATMAAVAAASAAAAAASRRDTPAEPHIPLIAPVAFAPQLKYLITSPNARFLIEDMLNPTVPSPAPSARNHPRLRRLYKKTPSVKLVVKQPAPEPDLPRGQLPPVTRVTLKVNTPSPVVKPAQVAPVRLTMTDPLPMSVSVTSPIVTAAKRPAMPTKAAPPVKRAAVVAANPLDDILGQMTSFYGSR